MATYFQPPEHHHHHHNNHHHGNTSDVDGGLQTLLLMNPNYVGYSESHAPPPSSPSPASNFLLHAPTLYHAPPPPPLPQLVGVPLQSSSDAYTQHYWAQLGHMAPERESPRAAQQGLSLSLSSSQNHSFSRAAAQAEPHQLQPSPSAEQNVHGGSSESPVATTVSAGDVAGLMNPSKYLKAAQQLLEEVVSVTVDRVKSESVKKIKIKGESPPASDSVAGDGSKEERAAELSPADKQELQMKKAKLITLLDEVEQRQRQYHQQMQAVVGSFEQVAGPNSARTYTCLALKTISSQFRFLRGAISGQIRAANRALGEGEGEGGWCSSRLKMLDQQIRQQGALQQLGMMQNNAWRPQRGLPEKAVSVLRAWLFEHFLHPYPKDSDKIMLAKQTGLTRSQVSNWFINARVRLWKPMIEEMYAEEAKEHQQSDQQHTSADGKDDQNGVDNQTKAPTTENHTSSVQISSSTTSIPPFKTNTHNPFTLVDDSEAQGILLKKQRNNEFPDSELFTSNNCKEEVQQHKYNLVPYPIGEISNGQFPTNFSGNGVSLTLGLPHCESISIQGNNQAFLPTNQEMDQYRARMEMAPNSGNAYAAAQLLHDFVA